MAPVVNGLEQRYAGRIRFVHLDIDDPAVKPWMEQLRYIGRPHFYLLDAQGNIAKQWIGYVSEDQLVSAMDALLAGQPIP